MKYRLEIEIEINPESFDIWEDSSLPSGQFLFHQLSGNTYGSLEEYIKDTLDREIYTWETKLISCVEVSGD